MTRPPLVTESQEPSSTPEFLAGGGELGALMRRHDWDRSPLGPPDRWPQALRTVVRLMLNTRHPMYVFWGPQSACLYNDAYRESIGPERHPVSLGRPAREVWEEIWPLIGPQIEQVMSGAGATWHVDHLVPITRHGRREDVYWTYSYSPIDDATADGGIGGVLVVCNETTRQVLSARADAALRESEMRFRSALVAGRMGAWETDLVAGTRTWTPEGMALFGLSLPEGRGRLGGAADEYAAALHPQDRHLAREYLELADRQDSFAAEYRIVRPDGTTLWLSGRGLVVARGADGRAQRLISIMADATERKQAEEVLRVERERLELALSAGQMGAYDLDIREDVLWWSPQTYAVFGVRADAFTPTRDSVTALFHPEDREGFLRLRAEAIAQRRPFAHEFRVVRGDGSVAWLGHRGQTEYDALGEPIRSFGVVMDITERKHFEQQLRDEDRKKDNFIATLAHELRNPLAPIRNAVSVLARSPDRDAQTAWCHQVIDRQAGQMAHLLDDLLDVSRMNRGELRLRSRPLRLATVVEQALEVAQPFIDAARHRLAVRMPAQDLHLHGDLTRLAQVYSNVLINAAKYTPPQGEIRLSAAREGEHAVVKVADSGIGIASQHLSSIFEMFGQVQSALNRSQGGQGIGLALAKGLVEMHGGTIVARSEGAGKGSEFEIRLPVASPPIEHAPPVVHAATAAVPGTLRILIADDLRDIADSLAMLLEAMGHVVAVAYDGEQALQAAERLRPRVVLLDLGMPKLNGLEVCRRIRAAPWGAAMTLIAQTGWGGEEDRRRTAEAGFDHHVIKPVDPVALLTLLLRDPQP
jgi:PAS domain S-box-containing protein